MIETTKCKIFEFKINSYKLAWISIVKNLNDFNRFIISENNYIKKINIEIEKKDIVFNIFIDEEILKIKNEEEVIRDTQNLITEYLNIPSRDFQGYNINYNKKLKSFHLFNKKF